MSFNIQIITAVFKFQLVYMKKSQEGKTVNLI